MTRVTLLLARAPDKPDGDIHDRLTLDLQLTPAGQIDPDAYREAVEPWLAFRDRGGLARALEILRIDDGWALQSTDDHDDPIWTFDGNVFRPGEVVSLRRPDQQECLFRIVSAEAT